MAPLTPSSSSSGFFQPTPVIPPQFQTLSSNAGSPSGDPVLSRLLSLYLPSPTPTSITTDLATFSVDILSPQILAHTRSCETTPPTLHPLNTFGAPNTRNPLRTSEGWRALQDYGIEAGIVGLGFDESYTARGWNRRMHQFMKEALWTGSAALVTCPSAMTDGAAVLLGRHLNDAEGGAVFAEARRRLVSRDVGTAWTSGQWMTERTGGSDVRGTETVAVRSSAADVSRVDSVGMPLGPWVVSGFKWFSSATDADMAVLLAQTENGLSAFYAPMRLENGDMNGVRIQRLKDKMGTKGLPTAELELKGMRAWLIGREGRGVSEISGILNITRLHTAIAAVGYWGRGLAVARAWSQVRKVSGGVLLDENKQHNRWMAGETVKYWAAMDLVFFGVALLGASEQGYGVAEQTWAGKNSLIPRSQSEIEVLLRIVTPLMKAQTTLASIDGLRACMESLGGVGYLENNDDIVLNIARLYRDANVGAIWEGTTSVMAEDLVRVLKGKTGELAISVLSEWVINLLQPCAAAFSIECSAVEVSWVDFVKLIKESSAEELHWRGREVLGKLESIVCACLLMADACRDRDEVAAEIARRWVSSRRLTLTHLETDWQVHTLMDCRIFPGERARSQARL